MSDYKLPLPQTETPKKADVKKHRDRVTPLDVLVIGGMGALAMAGLVHEVVKGDNDTTAKRPQVPVEKVVYYTQPGDQLIGIAARYAKPNTELRDDVDFMTKELPAGVTTENMQVGTPLELPADLVPGYKAEQAKIEAQRNAIIAGSTHNK